ncbi:T-cell immunomodulatory protein [Cichlidogyrus casuarinus]|uniref:T-cell immunomodulatory protein n=1 Tax=Cichlidogyrus casuarinus TaxID=1844966 RepID=A0ABD2QG18_9PLAT
MKTLFPRDLTEEEQESTKRRLTRLIISVLNSHSDLHYYQGFHDICFVFMWVLEDDATAYKCLKKLVEGNFRIFMQKTLQSSEEYLYHIYFLLKLEHPMLLRKIEDTNMEASFALAWVLTWFSHVLPNLEDIVRLYDVFIADDSFYMPIYSSVAIMLLSVGAVEGSIYDFGELYHCLTHLPKRHPVEAIIKKAEQLRLKHPVSALEREANKFLPLIQKCKLSKTSLRITSGTTLEWLLIVISDNLHSRPIRTFFIAGTARLFILFACLLVVCRGADTPTSSYGPGDASFSELKQYSGLKLACFVDVNNDRQTDTIVVTNDNGINVLLEPKARSSSAFIFDFNVDKVPTNVVLLDPTVFGSELIRAIMSSDFNGDSVADLLVLTGDSVNNNYQAYIITGMKDKNGNFKLGPKNAAIASFTAQPLIADLNSDGVADIYGELTAGERGIILGVIGASKFELQRSPSGKAGQWMTTGGGYSAFGDFNLDSKPSLIIRSNLKEFKFLGQSLVTPDQKFPDFSSSVDITIPFPVAVMGQFRFADFNRDGKLDFIVPVCKETDCTSSSTLYLYQFDSKKWVEIPTNLVPVGFGGSGTWSFTKASSDLSVASPELIGITHGDVDLDSWPDLTAVLTYTEGANVFTVPAILMNKNDSGKLQFQAYLLPGVKLSGVDIVQMGLFDQDQDGILDLWVTTKSGHGANSLFSTRLLKQKQSTNNYFLMTMVLSGLCPNRPDCMGYGIPTTGSTADFQTYSIRGEFFKSTGITAPLSSYTALELPYILFGVGELANYIEIAKIRLISSQPGTMPLLEKQQDFIVPDAQIVVNPFTRQDPSSWRVTSFLEPLRNLKVLIIAITMVALMIFLAILVTILQCMEVREDREEKMHQVQGFHF